MFSESLRRLPAGGYRRRSSQTGADRKDAHSGAPSLMAANASGCRSPFLPPSYVPSTESEYFTANRQGRHQLAIEYRFRPATSPSNAEIRDQIQAMALSTKVPSGSNTSTTCDSIPSS